MSAFDLASAWPGLIRSCCDCVCHGYLLSAAAEPAFHAPPQQAAPDTACFTMRVRIGGPDWEHIVHEMQI